MDSPKIVVISAPSGAGKTSIARLLLERFPTWRFSISATTRQRRDHERDGHDYFFLDREEFEARIERGEFVEWEEFFGSYYGTPKDEVLRLLSDADVEKVLFDIDVKGALSIREVFGEQAVLIFIAPPSLEVLSQRLRARKTESEDSFQRRMERVRMEMDMQGEFDYVVVNNDLARAAEELSTIVRAPRGVEGGGARG